MNAALREGKALDPETQAHAMALDGAIENGELGEDCVLYRGVNATGAKAILSKAKIGGEIRDAGFMSTTRDEEVAKNFMVSGKDNLLIRISAPAGTKALDVPTHHDLDDEKEVIFPRSSSLRVVGWNPKTRVLDVRTGK